MTHTHTEGCLQKPDDDQKGEAWKESERDRGRESKDLEKNRVE